MAGSLGSGEDPDFAHCMGVVFKVVCCLEFIEIFYSQNNCISID